MGAWTPAYKFTLIENTNSWHNSPWRRACSLALSASSQSLMRVFACFCSGPSSPFPNFFREPSNSFKHKTNIVFLLIVTKCGITCIHTQYTIHIDSNFLSIYRILFLSIGKLNLVMAGSNPEIQTLPKCQRWVSNLKFRSLDSLLKFLNVRTHF